MTFLVVGEALVDVVPARATDGGAGTRDLPGGSPANVALTLGRLDHRPTLVTSLGVDERGGLVRDWLEAAGVRIVTSVTSTGRTSSATVVLDGSGSATYDFDLTWEPPVGELYVAVSEADVVHAGSIATVLDPGAGSGRPSSSR